MSGVRRPSNLVNAECFTNSYVDLYARACLYGQDRGSQMHHKRAISSPKNDFMPKVESQFDPKCNFESVYAWRNIRITKIGQGRVKNLRFM